MGVGEMSSQLGGTQRGTADAALGTSGLPVRVKTVHFLSGGTASTLQLRNGTSASDTVYVTINGTISTGTTVNFGDAGIVFPSGCFVDVDANLTYFTITFAGVA